MKNLFQSRTIIVVILGLLLNFGLSKVGLTTDQLAETLAGVNGLFLFVVGLLRLDTSKKIDLSSNAGKATAAAQSTENALEIIAPIIEAILNRRRKEADDSLSQQGKLFDDDKKDPNN